MGRCWGLKGSLKSVLERCDNQAGEKRYCHRHKSQPIWYCVTLFLSLCTIFGLVNDIISIGKISSEQDLTDEINDQKSELSEMSSDINEIKSFLLEEVYKPNRTDVFNEIDKQLEKGSEIIEKNAKLEYEKAISAFEKRDFITASTHFDTAINLIPIPAFYNYKGLIFAETEQVAWIPEWAYRS